MFGYVCPKICELKVCEHEEYKRYYCGLCRALRKNYSRYSALFLSNDCVFVYLLISSMSESEPEYEKNRCILNREKRSRIVAVTEGADYAAALSVFLAYCKADDDVRDSGRFKSRFSRSMLKRSLRRASRKYPDADKAVRDMITGISELESEKCSDIDEIANAFAAMFGKLIELSDASEWEDLYDFGYNLGRYIYIMDAVDDLDYDSQSGEYNVLHEKFGDDIDSAREAADFNIFMSLAKAKEAFDRLRINRNKGILLNIITLGLSERAMEVLKGGKVESV